MSDKNEKSKRNKRNKTNDSAKKDIKESNKKLKRNLKNNEKGAKSKGKKIRKIILISCQQPFSKKKKLGQGHVYFCFASPILLTILFNFFWTTEIIYFVFKV